MSDSAVTPDAVSPALDAVRPTWAGFRYHLRRGWSAGLRAGALFGAGIGLWVSYNNGLDGFPDRLVFLFWAAVITAFWVALAGALAGACGFGFRAVFRRMRVPPAWAAYNGAFAGLLWVGLQWSQVLSGWYFFDQGRRAFWRPDRIRELGSALLIGAVAAAAITYGLSRLSWGMARRVFRIVGMGLCAGILFLGTLNTRAATPIPPRPAVFKPAPTGVKIALIGIDGATWSEIDPLMEAGRLPHIAALVRSGVRGVLKSEPPFASQACWTSIATGVSRRRSGVNAHLVPQLPGVRPFTVRSQDRTFLPFYAMALTLLFPKIAEGVACPSYLWKAVPMWEIASAGGDDVAVIGWTATWPSRQVHGVIVSDRLAHNGWETFYRHREDLEDQVSPAHRLEEFRALRVAPWEMPDLTWTRFFTAETRDLERLRERQVDILHRDPLTLFGRVHAMDQSYLAMAHHVLDSGQPRLLAVYTSGFDLAGHAFWEYMRPPDAAAAAAPLRAKFKDVIPRYLDYMDEEIGKLTGRLEPGTVVVVISDHGLGAAAGSPLWSAWHDENGIWLLSGGPVRKGVGIEPHILFDACPTLLRLLGYPVAEDIDGRPAEEIFTPEFVERFPLQRTATYRRTD